MKSYLLSALACLSPALAATLDPAVLVRFNGTVEGGTYILGAGEFDDTGTFKANGTPVITAGVAALDGGASNDGFDFNPTSLGSLTSQNWVAEAILAFDAFEGGQRTMIDVQGDLDFRVNNSANGLEAVYWDGSTGDPRATAPLPGLGNFVHYALVWDAAASSLTAYLNGVSIGTVDNNVFEVPDATNVSFGYLGRAGFDNRSIDGSLDAVSFATFTGAAFDPATDFQLYTPPPPVVYQYWDIDGATPGAGGDFSPSGNWGDANWSPSPLGDAVTGSWTNDGNAAFSAGGDATIAFTVDLGATAREATRVLVEEGDVTLSNGTLDLAEGGSLTAASGAFLEVAADLSAAGFQTEGNILLSGNTTVSGDLSVVSGQLTTDRPVVVGALSGAGNIETGANGFTFGSASDGSFAGILAGSGTVTKQGAGSQTLGNPANAFSGPLVVAHGSLVTGPAAGNGAVGYLGLVDGSRTIRVQSGATLRLTQANVFGGGGKTAASIPAYQIDGGTLRTVRFNIIGNTTLSNGASLANASTETSPDYGGFQLLGDVTVSGGGAPCEILDSGSTRPAHLLGDATTTFLVEDLTSTPDADLVVSTDLADGSGDYPGVASLTKTGAGTLALTGANSYSGTTTVSGGTLAVNGTALADSSRLVIDGGVVAPSGTEVVDTLFFGGVQQASGTWGASGSGATHIDDTRFSGSAGVILVTQGAGLDYAAWIAGFPGAAGAPGFSQDADGDGISNGVEQILGTDPSVWSAGLIQVSAGGTSVTFRHSQTNVPASDVTKTYEWSTDLGEWRPSGEANRGGTIGTIVATTITDNEAPENDLVEVVVSASGTASERLFVRLVANP